ncbi:hypothetical protein SDC9_64388 [bioreactor metagenome]|uniref:Uncharacterized protein n=1 Tax=bioreactor metagenome TaxID=1076179 RepID=A0A644XPT4_9ZZZZ
MSVFEITLVITGISLRNLADLDAVTTISFRFLASFFVLSTVLTVSILLIKRRVDNNVTNIQFS